ncbi:MAG: deoxyribose-phosphate aldolase [Oscillospiraceae bacterium]|nr:deoxyribose-phosphate aldolase [Oscillospiraceae bacterium]
MKKQEILSACDHTVLAQTARWEDICKACDEAIRYHCASVCIPPAFVREAAMYVAGRTPITTVIGFPNGYSTTAVKCFETADAIKNGAGEIDMVINLGWAKEGFYGRILDEIEAVREACAGHTLKVIIETCLLTEAEKIRLCEIVTRAGTQYIKTSTGFAGGGATLEDVRLLAEHIGPNLKIKASGGIASVQAAADMMAAGASRIGASRVVLEVRAEEKKHDKA